MRVPSTDYGQETRRFPPLKLPPMYAAQHKAICDPRRVVIIEASTKSGKTAGCILWLLVQAWNRTRVRTRIAQYWWVAPIFPQAKIAFKRLCSMLRQADERGVCWRKNESELYIELKNGSTIWFKGADKPDSLYGEDVYAAVIDEATRCKEDAWHAVRSTLTATKGVIRIIGNVKGKRNWVHQLAEKSQREGDADVGVHKLTAYDAVAGGIFDEAEIAAARRQLPDDVFRQLYLAQPAEGGGGIFHAFDYTFNVRPCVYDPSRTIVVGSDFNVDPMAWVIGHRWPDRIEIFDELFLRDSNTPKALEVLWAKWGHHQRGFEFYGDATGQSRKTAAILTDYQLIHNDKRFQKAGRSLHYLSANPPRKNRFDSCNAMFCTADGTRRLFIDDGCTELIKDLEYRQYDPGTFEPDDEGDSGHASDALGYIVYKLFPIKTLPDQKRAPVIIM